jgi:uncharacterized protein
MLERFEVKFADTDIDSKTGEFAGYGAVFGNLDSYGDVIEKGAFKDTLREWEDKGKYPPMLLQHGGSMMINADDMLPIGVWTHMEENSKGLKVQGRLFAMDTERGRYIYEGMKSGALDGLSIGYGVKKAVLGTKPTDPARRLTALDLREVSVVTFPANGKARVSAVKSAEQVKTIRDFEQFLRDAGYSHAAAKAIASGGFKASEPRDEDGLKDVAAALRRNLSILQT